ncbi:MAG: polyprenyl synthetase family protein, partial [Brachymonas sp.]
LDYEGHKDQLGKNLGDDLREGKVTLPLIIAMERASASESDLIREMIERPNPTQLDENLAHVLRIIESTQALQITNRLAAQEALRAQRALSAFPPSDFLHALLQLVHQSVHRTT